MGFTRVIWDLEGFQLKRKKVFAWLIDGSDLGKYCTDEVFRIAPGIKTALIKPMDRREVQVTISGLNINTPDSFIVTNIFGKLPQPSLGVIGNIRFPSIRDKEELIIPPFTVTSSPRFRQ